MARFYLSRIFIVLSFLIPISSYAEHSHEDHEGNNPIGVMGGHTHEAGDWMLSYRYMNMFMSGNRSGTSDVSNNQVLQQFMVTPTRMKMEMHMFGAMWAPNNRITVMGMVPYVRKSMDHVNRMGRTFNTESKGIGDIKGTALIQIIRSGHHHVHLNAGISFPTGAIDKRDNTLMPNVQLPYPMQLGSGTYDLLPGITYGGQANRWSWGSQAIYTARLGENSRDYTLGDQLKANLWGGIQILEWLSGSLRLEGTSWGDIEGADKELNPNMVPTADPKRRAGDRIDFYVGTNLYAPSGFLKGHGLALEVGFPIYQRLDGPQLETDYSAILGWQKSF